MKNTKEKGIVESIFFYDTKEKLYVGVCLTFDIISEGDTLEEVQQSLLDAISLHIRTVQENNFSDALLNRHAPKQYWELRDKLNKAKILNDLSRQRTRKPLQAVRSIYQDSLGLKAAS